MLYALFLLALVLFMSYVIGGFWGLLIFPVSLGLAFLGDKGTKYLYNKYKENHKIHILVFYAGKQYPEEIGNNNNLDDAIKTANELIDNDANIKRITILKGEDPYTTITR